MTDFIPCFLFLFKDHGEKNTYTITRCARVLIPRTRFNNSNLKKVVCVCVHDVRKAVRSDYWSGAV